MEILVKETRGAKRKYDFSQMKLGEMRSFEGTNTQTLISCAKRYCLNNNLSWRFRCYTEKDKTIIVRVK